MGHLFSRSELHLVNYGKRAIPGKKVSNGKGVEGSQESNEKVGKYDVKKTRMDMKKKRAKKK